MTHKHKTSQFKQEFDEEMSDLATETARFVQRNPQSVGKLIQRVKGWSKGLRAQAAAEKRERDRTKQRQQAEDQAMDQLIEGGTIQL